MSIHSHLLNYNSPLKNPQNDAKIKCFSLNPSAIKPKSKMAESES